MGKVLRERWRVIVGLAVWIGFESLNSIPCAGQYVYGPPAAPKSSFSNSIKQGFSKVGEAFTPKPKSNIEQTPADDPISLKNRGKPGPQLYAAVARLYEDSGKFVEAEQYYQQALKEKPDDLTALLGCARLQENQKRYNEALALYQRAVQAHPKQATAHNNLGLCYARYSKLNEAAQELGQAVQLDPRNPLYRNNLSAVLVDQNRLAEAFANLREVHGDAVAYYNMGYLLNKKGQIEAAEHHFAQALRTDPAMASAQRWLNYLQDKSRESAKPGQMGDASVRVGSLSNPSRFPVRIITPPASVATSPISSASPSTPMRLPSPSSAAGATQSMKDTSAAQSPSDTPPMTPTITLPQRLPPITLRQPAASAQSFQEMPASRAADSIAPLPPGIR